MAKIRSVDSSVLENWLFYGIDLTHRRVSFGILQNSQAESEDSNEFNEVNINLIIRGLQKMLDISNKPIEIHMNSYGGAVYDMLALHDFILESGAQFKFFGRGKIMSAATWIMAVCDERYLSENTEVMLHHGSDGFNGSQTDLEIYTKRANYVREKTSEIFAKNSFWSKQNWELWLQRDLYISAEEAVKDFGIADVVLPTRKRGNFRRGVRAKTFESHPSKTQALNIHKKISKRINLPNIFTLKVQVPKEKFEDISEYDNTEEEMRILNETTEPKKSD